ncbi:hypothetical protein TNCV_960881 [Trichonephila clavipes]|uniref:Uncharacterized protein n=1 Tax=Trichonephila clavipes TaxID=2585209 RepID=A0A8X6V5B9_TRICX|nr:hypothetical protein TNCV_960881 [Trichonephila clavipes]
MQSDLTIIPTISRKIKGVSEIRIQILVPYSEMHLVSTFGVPAPASSVPEETGSTIVRHYAAKLLEFLKSHFRYLFLTQKNTPGAHFAHSKILRVTGTLQIRFSISAMGLNFSALVLANSQVGLERETTPPNFGNILQIYESF